MLIPGVGYARHPDPSSMGIPRRSQYHAQDAVQTRAAEFDPRQEDMTLILSRPHPEGFSHYLGNTFTSDRVMCDFYDLVKPNDP